MAHAPWTIKKLHLVGHSSTIESNLRYTPSQIAHLEVGAATEDIVTEGMHGTARKARAPATLEEFRVP